jgi:hypothetical protein
MPNEGEGRICPQCGYQRQPKDLAPDYECPRCGIIYAKYRPPEPKSAPAAGTAPPEERAAAERGAEEALPEEEDGGLRPASPLVRAFAAFHTFGLVILYFVPAKLIVYAAFRFTHPPDSLDLRTALATARSWETGYYLYLVLLILYAFLLHPWLDGRSWGQRKFGLVLRPRQDPEGRLLFKDYLLRFAGQLLALCTWPVTLAGLIYDLAARRNDPGIADRISSTRQHETEKPLPFRAGFGRAGLPLSLALILQLALVGPLSYWLMKGYLERPRQQSQQGQQKSARQLHEEQVARVTQQQMRLMQAEPAAGAPRPEERGGAAPAPEAISLPGPEAQADPEGRRAAAARQNSLAILAGMEQRHLRDRGSFTEELEALVAKYGTNPVEAAALQSLIAEGALRARKTTQGVEIWLQSPSGEWTYREVRK